MILATRHHGDVEIRANSPYSTDYLPSYAEHLATSGIFNRHTVYSVPAVTQAIRIASQAVASLAMRVWRGENTERSIVKATWQARFFDSSPNEEMDWFTLWEATEASLTARNNAYWRKIRLNGRLVAVDFLHPDYTSPLVEKGRVVYRVWNPFDAVNRDYQPSDIIHFRGFGGAGFLAAPSPVDIFRDALRKSHGQIRWEAGFYERGMGQDIAVSFPDTTTVERAREYRDLLDANHRGVENQHRTRVVGGGATISTIGVSLRDAQYIESSRFGVEEIGRIYNVTSSLLGVADPAIRGLSPEHEQTRWLRYGLEPRLIRIENAIKHDPDFFGGSATRDYPAFDTNQFVRGDLKTEADISLTKVQSGQWLVDEARARDGLPPLPDGIGKIPQIVPVGGAPNPAPPGNPPAAPSPQE